MTVSFASRWLSATLGTSLRKSKLIRNNANVRTGYHGLAGQYPGGLTSLEGVPTPAQVRVFLRAPATHPEIDGTLVAVAESAGDGTWYIGGLNPLFTYDVVGHLAGEQAVIVSDVAPFYDRPRRVSTTGDVRVSTTGDTRVAELPWPT